MSPGFPLVRLLTDELPRGPWIFGRQVEEPQPAPEPGDLVEVRDRSDRYIGFALYNPASDVRLRVLTRGRKTEFRKPAAFLADQLRLADKLRRKVLRLDGVTDAYRIVHGEGDDLPGLVVDRLGDTLVCEHHALGFWRLREEIAAGLGQLYPGFPVVHRVPNSARKLEDFDPPAEPVAAETIVTEHGIRYPVSPAQGHKTGFFCDQRDNRRRIGELAEGSLVLDLCTNAGGFALHAARGGARGVIGVDLDEVVLERAVAAAALNKLPVDFVHEDCFRYMRAKGYGNVAPRLVILDPHKLVPNRARYEEGLRHYSDMNTLALAAVAPGGLLATFSCSGPVDLPAFLGMVFSAARRAEREVRLLETLSAGPDHPQRPDFPRSRYLKGALFAVD